MPAVHYSATFSDGTRVTRTTAPSSLRTYTHAWRVTHGYATPAAKAAGWTDKPGVCKPGFSGSESLARGAGNTVANGWRPHYIDVAVEVVRVTIHPSRQAAKEGV